MFAAVSLFQFLFNLNIPIPGRFDEPLIAAVAYWVVVAVLFRIAVVTTFYIAAAHAGLWLAIWIAMVLHGWTTGPAPSPPAPASPPGAAGPAAPPPSTTPAP